MEIICKNVETYFLKQIRKNIINLFSAELSQAAVNVNKIILHCSANLDYVLPYRD